MEISTASQTAPTQRLAAPVMPPPVKAALELATRATAKADALERADAVSAAEKKKSPIDAEKVQLALAEINQAMQIASIGVRFEFDTTAEKMVTKVVDVASGDVIRQMPTEEVLRMSKALDKLQGLLVNHAV
jgi:flagellar protein FlaG